MDFPKNLQAELFEYIVRLGDDRLIMGHRLSEWCGHAPTLEEDIALANIALDNIGHASALLRLAGELEGKGRTDDDLAYLRNERDFRCLQLVEQPRGDFAFTVAKQFLFDVYSYHLYSSLCKSKFSDLAGLAFKILKEVTYHVRHSKGWLLRLGDGTQESHERMQNAVSELWRFTSEMFESDEVDRVLVEAGIGADLSDIRCHWEKEVRYSFDEATLLVPLSAGSSRGSRGGLHTEHLGHLLAEMQSLPRAFPGAKW